MLENKFQKTHPNGSVNIHFSKGELPAKPSKEQKKQGRIRREIESREDKKRLKDELDFEV